MTDKEYELVEKYLRKKYGNDYVDFIDTEGQSYLDGLAEGITEAVIKNLKENTSVITTVIMGKLSEKCEQLEKENKELKAENKKLNQTEWEDADTIAHMASTIAELEEVNAKLKVVCDYNCPDHKLATHNACLLCPAIRNSPYHNLKNVSDEELQIIIKNAEIEAEM